MTGATVLSDICLGKHVNLFMSDQSKEFLVWGQSRSSLSVAKLSQDLVHLHILRDTL